MRVRWAQEGDRQAQDSLVRSFQTMAVGYATSVLGDAHRAEDVAQEAFVEAFRRLSSLEYPEAFPQLLKALIRKHCDRLTRGRPVVMVPLDDIHGKASRTMDPMHLLQENAIREMVRQAVDGLGEADRAVVVLFYLEERSLLQIAVELSLPVSTVKSRLYEARQKLKRKMWMLEEEESRTERTGGEKQVVKKPYIPDPTGKIVIKKNYLKKSV